MILTLLLPMAQAASVAATVEVQGGQVPVETARALVWHALVGVGQEPPMLLDRPPSVRHLTSERITTLLDIDVTWNRDALWLDARVVWAEAPLVTVTEYIVKADTLVVVDRQTHRGAPVARSSNEGWTPWPEEALQRTVASAVATLAAPEWTAAGSPLRVPVVVAADEAYRGAHGSTWQRAATERIERASALLQSAGIAVDILGFEDWTAPHGEQRPGVLLEHFAQRDASNGHLRLGLSARAPAIVGNHAEIGAAYAPGSHMVVIDHMGDAQTAVAVDGTAIAHELLHALGVPHPTQPDVVMSDTLAASVHRLDPATQALARAAAQARWAHWDPKLAAQVLADAAATWIPDGEDQLTYVAQNLAAAEGASKASSRRWSALARTALALDVIPEAVVESPGSP